MASEWSRSKVLRGAGMIGALTLLGKVLTWSREVAVAYLFGASATTDALVLASTVAGSVTGVAGAVVALSVPLMVERGRESQSEDRAGLSSVVTVTLVLTLVLVAIGFFAPLWGPSVIRLLAPGWSSAAVDLCVEYLYLFYAGGVLGAFAAMASAYLVTEGSFVPAGLVIAMNGLGAVSVIIIASPALGGRAVAFGAIADGLIACIIVVMGMRRLGVRLSSLRGGRTPWGLVLRTGSTAAIVYLMMNAAVIVSRSAAAALPTGTVALMGWAERLLAVPASVAIVPLAQALYPAAAREAAIRRGSADGAAGLARTGQLVVVSVGLTLLVAPVLAASSRGLTQFALGYGRMGSESVGVLGCVVGVLLLSLPGLAASTMASRVLYASEAGRTVVLWYGLGFLVQGLMVFPLSSSMGIQGIAFSAVIAAFLSGGGMLYASARRGGLPAAWMAELWRSGAAGSLAGGVALAISLLLGSGPAADIFALLVGLGVAVAIGGIVGSATAGALLRRLARMAAKHR